MSTPLSITRLPHHDLKMPYHDIGPRHQLPRLAVVAGLGGNGLNGMFVLSRLAELLASIESGERADWRLRARVVIVPAVNPLCLEYSDCRALVGNGHSANSFGNCNHDAAAQLQISAVGDITRDAYYRIDIHSSNLDIEEMPQVRLYEPNDDERATACLFGLPAVIERPTENKYIRYLVAAWRIHGGENFVVQAGHGGNLQLAHCESVFRALLAFLDRTGIVEGLNIASEDDDLHYFGETQTYSITGHESGIFVPRATVGQRVHVGTSIGQTYDGVTGAIRAEIESPVAGVLSSLRRQPLLVEGALIARIQTDVPTRPTLPNWTS